MKLFNKLPGTRREPAGLEILVLKSIPQATFATTLIPALFYLLISSYPELFRQGNPQEVINTAWITAVVVILTSWTIIFTAALASFIVYMMKGPAYVADAYPLSDADKPRKEMQDDDGKHPLHNPAREPEDGKNSRLSA